MVKLYKKNNCYIDYIKDYKYYMQQQFFTKGSFQKIFISNYEILLINIKYNINKYKILIIIVSKVTLLNKSYYVGFIFVFKKNTKFI